MGGGGGRGHKRLENQGAGTGEGVQKVGVVGNQVDMNAFRYLGNSTSYLGLSELVLVDEG